MAKKVTESSGNIFLDLGFPPHEAAVMLLRAELAEALRVWIEREKLTQAQAAKRLKIAQPRMSEDCARQGGTAFARLSRRTLRQGGYPGGFAPCGVIPG